MVLLNALLGMAILMFIAITLSVISRLSALGQQLEKIAVQIQEAEEKEQRLSTAATLEELASLR